MTRLTSRETKRLLLLGILYAAVATSAGVRRGGDLAIHFGAARLLLGGLPLYAHGPPVGVWWPPAGVLLVAPFALVAQLSEALAKAAWAAGSVVCLGWSIAQIPRETWKSVALAVAATAVPIHRNFEDLNLNAVLLALLVAAAGDLGRGRERRAGAWIGVATALKVFPVIWLVYLAYRRHWRALAVGIAVAIVLTLAPLLRYGVGGAFAAMRDWLVHSAPAAWVQLGSNQSLTALATRLHIGRAGSAVLDLACLALAAVALRRPKVMDAPYEELAIIGLLAVLVSPMAWVHYFVFALPVWLVALRLPRDEWGRGWTVALFAAGFATSGIATVWSIPVRNALFEISLYTWGTAVLLFVVAFAPRGRFGPVTASAGPPAASPRQAGPDTSRASLTMWRRWSRIQQLLTVALRRSA